MDKRNQDKKVFKNTNTFKTETLTVIEIIFRVYRSKTAVLTSD